MIPTLLRPHKSRSHSSHEMPAGTSEAGIM